MSFLSATRREFLAGSIAAAGLLVAGRRGHAAGGVLRIRNPHDMKSIDPMNYQTRSDINIGLAVFNKLIQYKPSDKWEWDYDVAEHIAQADPTHIEFKLKPGVQWTDGFGEVTAEDVKFSFERVINPDNKSPFSAELNPLEKVEVTGPLSGVLVLKEPSAAIWSFLPWYTASIVSKAAVEKAGGTFTTEPPATSGAYKIKEWIPKQKLVLVRNELWKGTPADFDEVHVIPVDDDKTAELAFEAGDLDFTEVAVSSIPTLTKTPPKRGRLIIKNNLGIRWLGMNTEAKPFDDERMRRAVQLGIDVPALLEGAYFGMAERATGIVPPGMLGHRDANTYPNRDVEQAKKLLAEAGYDGAAVTLTVENNTDMTTLAQIVQAQLGEIGMNVEINALESGQFWTYGSEKDGDNWKKLQIQLQNWGWAPDPSSATMWFTPDQVGIWNWERWRSDEYASLHKAALGELDADKRGKLYQKMQDLMEGSGAYLFLTPGINPLLAATEIEPAVSPDGRRYFMPQFKHKAG
jgi:peptide/nickel transport system substrate-binding protein